jgi:adenosylmethionine-8-amino-7-oxononanoate aminotransferase
VVELSERLSALAGGALGHAFYASDGASAVEIALKMSFHARVNGGQAAKREFACLEGSYHGETMGALGVTDVPVFRDAYGPLVRAAHRVPSPDARGAVPGETAADVARRAADGVEALFAAHAESISALIVEPLVQCATGMAMHDPEYLRRVRALCDRFDVHLILDEIAVGFGRTGTMFAHEQAAAGDRPCRPDFLCLSKGISGGYLPLSVVLTTDKIYDAFYDDRVTRGFLHSHSYTGNPLACRAALATLDLLAGDFAGGGPARRAGWLKAAFAPLAGHARVRHLRQTGSIVAFDLVDPAPDFARRCFAEGLQRELLIRPIGGTVYVMPPYLLSEQDADWLGRTVLATVGAALGHAPAPQPQAILP